MAISDARLKEYIANFILLCIVVISWTYTIISGKFISERHLHTLNLEEHHRNIDKLLLQGESIQTVQIKPKNLRVNIFKNTWYARSAQKWVLVTIKLLMGQSLMENGRVLN